MAKATASASRTRCGAPIASSASAIGLANAKIAATHENESANDTLVSDVGPIAVTTIAAAASAFHDVASRPAARARSANDNIVAARTDGR